MVTNIAFKLNPDELYEIIRKNVDKNDFADPYKNLDGNPVNIEKISYDIYEAYKNLYVKSDRLKGNISLEKIKKEAAYKEFVSKMFFRYKAADFDKNAKDPYCWMTFLFTNYKQNEIEDFCKKAFAFVKKEKVRKEIFTSPDIKSKAGRVSIPFFIGLGEIDEMIDLYETLEREGIDLYIVSASFIDIVRAFASKNSYNLKKEKILGLRLAKDADGKILPKLDHSYPLTQKAGKTETIKRLIQNEKNYGPILVGGDSDGDYNMLTDFRESNLGIIINVERKGKINKLKEIARAGNSKYVIQERDEYSKCFIDEERFM